MAPLQTGATGIRNATASSTISAVVRVEVHEWTMSFHSSHAIWRDAEEANLSASSGRPIMRQNDENCSNVFVVNTTNPSLVGSMAGVSVMAGGPLNPFSPRMSAMSEA